VAEHSLYKVAYEEAVRTLSEQRAAVDGIRSRAGLLFSVAAITTSFLGAQALRGDPGPLAWMALAGFVGMAGVFLVIFWPRRWELTINPHEVIGSYIEATDPAAIPDLHRELSFHMYSSYLKNKDGLGELVVCFQIANVLLAAELVLWITALALAP
jgi:hypothetical protein